MVIPHEDLSLLKVRTEERNQSEETEALYIAIRELNEIDRMIVTLHLDGYENKEIAEISGLTKNNTDVKLHRKKETLTIKLKAV